MHFYLVDFSKSTFAYPVCCSKSVCCCFNLGKFELQGLQSGNVISNYKNKFEFCKIYGLRKSFFLFEIEVYFSILQLSLRISCLLFLPFLYRKQQYPKTKSTIKTIVGTMISNIVIVFCFPASISVLCVIFCFH